jgi:hypothetical protein
VLVFCEIVVSSCQHDSGSLAEARRDVNQAGFAFAAGIVASQPALIIERFVPRRRFREIGKAHLILGKDVPRKGRLTFFIISTTYSRYD